MKRNYYFMAILFLLTANTSCRQHTQDTDNVPLVRTDTIRAADGETTLQYPGKVKAAQDISLSFRVGGTLNRIWVEDGARVSEGQLLAELDPTDYQVQLEATQAEYEQIKSEAERVMALYRDEGTTPAANDKAVYGLKQITAKYQHHKDQLAYTKLYAPFSGYVQKRLFEAHETVAAGMPVISMISGGMPEVEINLPAAEYARRESFSHYHCTFDIYPGRSYPLKLISITPKANANQLYTVHLQLAAEGNPVPSPGMNTMVTIRCTDDSGAASWSVPTGAILRKDGKSWVYVYKPADGTVHRREVTLLRLLNNGRTVITSAQLTADEQVVASGVNHLKDGDSVKLLPPISETNVGGLL